MFSKRNVIISVVSVMVIGIVVLLLIQQQRPVVPEHDNPVVNVVNTVSQNEQIKHPALPKNSPFRVIVPGTLFLANFMYREPAQLGRLLKKVLIEYDLIDKPLPPDKTKNLPPLVITEAALNYQEKLGFYFIARDYHGVHKDSKSLTEVEHQFYVKIMTTIAKQSPGTFTRFSAATYLADCVIAGSREEDPPEKSPVSLEDVRQCYDSAFASLFDQAESMSDYELNLIAVFFSIAYAYEEGFLFNFLMVEALSSKETTEKGIQRALNARMKSITDKLELIAARTKSPERRKSLNEFSKSLKKSESSYIPIFSSSASAVKQVRPFAESFIAAVNDEDLEAMLKHCLNSESELITYWKNTKKYPKSLRDEFSTTKNTTSLRLLGINSLAIRCDSMFKKDVFSIPNKNVFSITLYLAVTDSNGVTKVIEREHYWGRQNGKWKIANRNK
ncbi:hypothetical protein MNBD_PLANCTO02-1152 [hydrothermal vent metagenome]|uniref:Uncharacterized protein n=1 Tax=hydrothermal vent metagenome TaxID=652676 RepID=A0A3B1DPS5_9ZZZZ